MTRMYSLLWWSTVKKETSNSISRGSRSRRSSSMNSWCWIGSCRSRWHCSICIVRRYCIGISRPAISSSLPMALSRSETSEYPRYIQYMYMYIYLDPWEHKWLSIDSDRDPILHVSRSVWRQTLHFQIWYLVFRLCTFRTLLSELRISSEQFTQPGL